MTEAKTKIVQFMAEMDLSEIACRFVEGETGINRPEGDTGAQELRCLGDEQFKRLHCGAKRVFDYFVECIEKGQVPS